MPPVADPPAAPSAPAAPVKELQVSQIPPPAVPPPPPKPGSARDRMHRALEKSIGIETPEPTEPPSPAKPAEGNKPNAPSTEPPKPAEGSTAPDPNATPTTTPDGKKVSPWKLVDQFKERATKAEQRALELEKQLQPEPERKAATERLQRAEQRVTELEDEIRYVNYSKSSEFQTKYQAPYEQAWRRALTELKEISIQDPQTQQRRAVTADDMMQLVNLPLGQARDVADQLFGKFADDVMGHRKEIRTLFEAQSSALEEAKTKGSEREQQRKEQFQRLHGAVSQQIKETWDKVNASVLEDPVNGEYFKPREGDEDWNQRLGKGFELVDRAFSENPMDPRLSAEQRADVVKRHAAVRNRAAGWGPLKFEVGRLKAKLAELEKELKQYKTSTPAAGGTQPSQSNGETGTARERMHAALLKISK